MRFFHATIGAAAVAATSALAWSWISVDVRGPASAPTPVATDRGAHLTIDRHSVDGRSYVLFAPREANITFTLTRPSHEDPRTLLAVAGTYTSPHDTVEGYVVLDGRIVQANERQGWDGAVIVDRGRAEIIATENGRRLTRAFLRAVASRGASLFQTHLLVREGIAQRFKPQPALPRRALAVLSDASPAIIESVGAVDLTTFAADLTMLGIRDAANLDMGTWSEGWYRDPATGAITTIGVPNPATARQTNWIVLERGAAR